MPPPPIPTSPSDNVSSGGGKLRKENPAARSRSGSLQHTSSNSNGDSIQALKTRQTSPVPDRGRRSSSVQSPNSRNNNTKSRVVSTPLAIRPGSSKGDASQSPTRGRLRRSWLPGGRSRSNSMDVSNTNTSTAWVLSDDTQAEYNASFLKNGEKVSDVALPSNPGFRVNICARLGSGTMERKRSCACLPLPQGQWLRAVVQGSRIHNQFVLGFQ